MAAGKYTFSIEQGTTINFELIYKDSTGQPIDLTGYSGKMQIRPDYADNTNTVFLTLSSSLNADGTGLNFSGSSGTNPLASGSIGIFISSCTSSMFTFNEGFYDLELYQEGPTPNCPIVTRLLEGKIKVLKEVTR
jgi:hypothetical protein